MKIFETSKEVGEALEKLQALFKPFMKLTFIARDPNHDEAAMIVSNDDLATLPMTIDKYHQREVLLSAKESGE